MHWEEAPSWELLTAPCSEEILPWLGHSFLKVAMCGLCWADNYNDLAMWEWKMWSIPFFYLLTCQPEGTLTSFFRLPVHFIPQIYAPKIDHIGTGIGYEISRGSPSSSLLSAWDHIPILWTITCVFFCILVELICQLLSTSSSSEQLVLCSKENWETLNLILAIRRSEDPSLPFGGMFKLNLSFWSKSLASPHLLCLGTCYRAEEAK